MTSAKKLSTDCIFKVEDGCHFIQGIVHERVEDGVICVYRTEWSIGDLPQNIMNRAMKEYQDGLAFEAELAEGDTLRSSAYPVNL